MNIKSIPPAAVKQNDKEIKSLQPLESEQLRAPDTPSEIPGESQPATIIPNYEPEHNEP